MAREGAPGPAVSSWHDLRRHPQCGDGRVIGFFCVVVVSFSHLHCRWWPTPTEPDERGIPSRDHCAGGNRKRDAYQLRALRKRRPGILRLPACVRDSTQWTECERLHVCMGEGKGGDED